MIAYLPKQKGARDISTLMVAIVMLPLYPLRRLYASEAQARFQRVLGSSETEPKPALSCPYKGHKGRIFPKSVNPKRS